ncbi:MAG: hypothetical protein JWQ62_977, partial [Lacunisphaera sp.]|nr:hypothetical protein [Lacunisphaera sp.]
ALKWPESRDETTDSEVLAIARHMQSLTASMLALSRNEAGQPATPLEAVDAPALVHETWKPFAARAQERRLRVEFALAPGCVPADPVLLRSVLTNLFDNAVDYTPEGGTIRIAFAGAEPDVAFSVGNPAGNLEAVDTPKLFDPFWRKEAARSGGRHVGLGLSLSRTFAAAMGWTLSASHEGGQLVLRLARGRAGTAAAPA